MKFGEVSIIKVFFIVSIVTFFVIFTIYILNLAQGNTITRSGEVIETSILRIDSNQSNYTVKLNGEQKQLVENRVEGIIPGEVTVEITKDGFTPWSKIILIEPKTVKDISVQLFPVEMNLSQITSSDIDYISTSTDSSYLFYIITNSKIAGENGIYKLRLYKNIIEIGQNQPQKIADLEDSLVSTLHKNDYEIIVSPDSNNILLSIPESKSLFLYDTNAINERSNLVTRIGFLPDKIYWLKDNTLFISKGNLYSEFDLGNNEQYVINFGIENLQYALSEDSVLYVKNNENKIYRYQDHISTLVEFPKSINFDGDLLGIYAPRENKDAMVINLSNDYYYIDIEKEFIEKVGRNININEISTQGKHLIIEKNGDYFSYNISLNGDTNKLSSVTKDIKFSDDSILDLYFINAGNNLVTIYDAASPVEFRDSDGQNPIQILTKATLIGNTVVMTPNSDYIYLLLVDDNATADSTQTQNNIYRVDLSAN